MVMFQNKLHLYNFIKNVMAVNVWYGKAIIPHICQFVSAISHRALFSIIVHNYCFGIQFGFVKTYDKKERQNLTCWSSQDSIVNVTNAQDTNYSEYLKQCWCEN